MQIEPGAKLRIGACPAVVASRTNISGNSISMLIGRQAKADEWNWNTANKPIQRNNEKPREMIRKETEEERRQWCPLEQFPSFPEGKNEQVA